MARMTMLEKRAWEERKKFLKATKQPGWKTIAAPIVIKRESGERLRVDQENRQLVRA